MAGRLLRSERKALMVESKDFLTERLRRIARALSVLIIGFALFMFIGHIVMPVPLEADYPPIENLLPVLMTLSVLSLGVAWRWEGLGGMLCVAMFIIHLLLFWAIRLEFFPIRALVLFSPVLLTGVLFLVCWWRSRGS
jgi:hypothetical protein